MPRISFDFISRRDTVSPAADKVSRKLRETADSAQQAGRGFDKFGNDAERSAKQVELASRQVEAASIAEEKARIRVAQAEERLKRVNESSKSSDDQKRNASLALRQAQLGLADASDKVSEAHVRHAHVVEESSTTVHDAAGKLWYTRDSLKSLGDEVDKTGRKWSMFGRSDKGGGFDAFSRSAGQLARSLNLIDFAGPAAKLAPLAGAAVAAGGALVALASSAGLASGSLAALIPAAVGAATVVGTVALAWSGVSKALKLHSQMQDAAVTGAGKAAKAEASSAAAIRAAQDSVADARRAQSRAAEDGAERIRSAQMRVVDAEREHEQAVMDLKVAQFELTEAWEEADRQLEDLQEQVKDAALTEEGARLRLARAQERALETARDEKATALDRLEAAHSVREAEDALSDAIRDRSRTTEDAAKTQARGIDRMDGVVAAQTRVSQAEDRVRESSEALSEAQRDVGKAQRDAAQAQQDAARNVSRALAALAAAQEKAATSAGAANTAALKYNDALAKLTPQGRAFVKQLLSMQPLLDTLRATAERTMLPGLTRGLRDSVSLFPIVNTAIGQTGSILGRVGADLGRFVKTPLFQAQMRTVVANNTAALSAMGTTAVPMAGAISAIAAASAPLVKRFADWAARTLNLASNFVIAKGKTGELTEFFKKAGDEAAKWGDIFGNVFGAIFDVMRAALPTGQKMSDSLRDITQRIKDWTGSAEGQQKIKDFFEFVRKIDYGRILQVAAGIAAVSLALKGLQAAAALSTVLMTLSAGPVGIAVVAIGALAVGLGLLWVKSEAFRRKAAEVATEVANRLTPVIQNLHNWWDTKLRPALEKFVQNVMPGVKSAWQSISSAVGENRGTFEKLGRVIGTVINFFVTKVIPILGTVLGAVLATTGGAIGKFIRIFAGIAKIAGWIATETIEAFRNLASNALGYLSNILDGLANVAEAGSHLPGKLGEKFGAAAKTIRGVGYDVNQLQAKINALHGKNVPISVQITAHGLGGVTFGSPTVLAAAHGRAYGGWMRGPGGPRGDRIPAMLSDGEYVVQAPAARALEQRQPGVLDAVINQAHKLDIGGDTSATRMSFGTPLRYATGGAVNIAAIQQWMRAQHGGRYVWGGYGFRAADCSGFAGNAWAYMTGHPLYRRYMTTRSLPSIAGSLGLRRGVGQFTIGNDPGKGHMAFNVAGLAGEAASTRRGMLVGRAAKSVMSFPQQWTLGGKFAPGGGGGGGGGVVLSPAQVNSILSGIAPKIAAMVARDLGFQARATGGPVRRGKAYVVGENGPEMFMPGASGYVTPGSASPAVHIAEAHFHGVQNVPQMVAELQDYARKNGGLAIKLRTPG